jgi:hypothetical protein
MNTNCNFVFSRKNLSLRKREPVYFLSHWTKLPAAMETCVSGLRPGFCSDGSLGRIVPSLSWLENQWTAKEQWVSQFYSLSQSTISQTVEIFIVRFEVLTAVTLKSTHLAPQAMACGRAKEKTRGRSSVVGVHLIVTWRFAVHRARQQSGSLLIFAHLSTKWTLPYAWLRPERKTECVPSLVTRALASGTDRAGTNSNASADLYSTAVLISAGMTALGFPFVDFLSSSSKMLEQYLKLNHSRLFPHFFQFIIHW